MQISVHGLGCLSGAGDGNLLGMLCHAAAQGVESTFARAMERFLSSSMLVLWSTW